MSYELVAARNGGGGTKRTAEEGCQSLIEELKHSFNLDDNISYDDLIAEVKQRKEEIPYEVTVKTINGRTLIFGDVTTKMTLDDFYDRLYEEGLGHRAMLKLIHNSRHVPYWVPEKEYKPNFMIPAGGLPLLDVLNINVPEIETKKVSVYVLLRLGGPPGTTETDDKFKLCPANAVVFGNLRDTIFGQDRVSKYNANLIVERLRKAYEEYEDGEIKICPLSMDVIRDTTEIGGGGEFETFPFPHGEVETNRDLITQQKAIGRCVGFYDFAYLMKWMITRRRWPLDNTDMSQEDVLYLTNLANHFYEGKRDPRYH